MPLRARLQSYRITDFTGGRNTVASSFDLEPRFSPDDLNCDLRTPGSVRKRLGYRRWVSAELGPDPVTGLYRYYKADGTKHLMVLCGSDLWDGVGGPLPPMTYVNGNFTKGSFMTFATMQDWCYMANYNDACRRYDGTYFVNVGLIPPSFPASITQANSGTTGRMSTGEYIYGFTYKYGALGESNMTIVSTGGSFWHDLTTGSAIDLGNLDSEEAFWDPNDPQPISMGIYRTLVQSGVYSPTWPSDDVEEVWGLLPFYYVDEIDFGTASYTDTKGDDQLITAYRGDDLDVPKARYLAEHRNRLFYANCYLDDESNPGPDFPSRIYYSEFFQPDRIRNFIDIYPEDGDEITGIVSLHNNMVIFKNRKTYLLLGTSESDFEVRLVNGGLGCIAPRTIHTRDNIVFFMADDGFYGFDGQGFTRYSDLIRDDFIEFPQTGRQYAAAGGRKGRSYFAVKEGS